MGKGPGLSKMWKSQYFQPSLFTKEVEMIPVFQTITKHDPANLQFGNCYQAAIASVLDLTLESVPHFGLNDKPEEISGEEFAKRINQFLGPLGLRVIWFFIPLADVYTWRDHLAEDGHLTYHLIGGKSIRGNPHVTVGLNGKLVHDPHPDGGPLSPVDGKFDFGFFIRTTPVPLGLNS
jgi:hypothetical protein